MPAKNAGRVRALAKTGGTYANFASAAAGSLPHFFGLMFAKAAGLQLTHVPYKGTAAVMQAMMSGEIPAAVLTVADWGTLVQSGKGRMLAVSSASALAQYPDVPTFKESGYDIEGSAWYAPVRAGRDAAGRHRQARHGRDRGGPSARRPAKSGADRPRGDRPRPGRDGAILRADYDKWGPMIRASGFKAD